MKQSFWLPITIFFLNILFVSVNFLPENIREYGLLFPRWFISMIIIIPFMTLAMMCMHFSTMTKWRIRAYLFLPALSVALVRIFLTQKSFNPLDLVIIILWIMLIVDFCWQEWFCRYTFKYQQRAMIVATSILVIAAGVARWWQSSLTHPFWILMLITATLFIVRATIHQKSLTYTRSVTICCLILTVLAFGWGVWLRFAAVNALPLQNDEYYHANTAAGYIMTQQYVQWDFVRQIGESSYLRAWPYTWQVAQSMRIFGTTEFAIRFPSLLWSVTTMMAVVGVTWCMTRRWTATALSSVFIAAEPLFIWSAAYSRMYSMLACLSIIAIFFVTWSMLEQKHTLRHRIIALIIGVILIVAAVAIHPVAYLLAGGSALIVLFTFIVTPKDRLTRMVLCITLVGEVIMIITQQFHPFLPLWFFKIRFDPLFVYLDAPFRLFVIPIVGMSLVCASLILPLQRLGRWRWAFGLMIISSLIFFVYFSARYGASKYSLFIYPALFVLIASVCGDVWDRYVKTPRQFFVASIVTMWVIIPFQIPGIVRPPLITPSRADKTITDLEAHDYEKGYAFLESRVTTGDAMILLSPQTLYMHRHDLNIYPMGGNQTFSLRDLRRIMDSHATGYVVWPKYKNVHILAEIRAFMQKHLEYVSQPQETNIMIYYWGKNTLL